MQKWEYLFVRTMNSGSALYPVLINGVEQKNWNKGATLYQYTAQLGNDGWELAGAIASSSVTDTLIFKRPKP